MVANTSPSDHPSREPLSHAELDSFRENGYLAIPDFVPEADCIALRARAMEIVSDTSPEKIASTFSTTNKTHTQDDYFMNSASSMNCFFEEDAIDSDGNLLVDPEYAINKIGHAQHDLDPTFESFSYNPAVADIAQQLGYVRPLALQAMYIFKAPGTGGEVIAHTDHPFLWTDPPSVKGFWFAIDDATEENGCLWAQPGGHLTEPIRSRFHRVSNDSGVGSGGDTGQDTSTAKTTTDILNETPYDHSKFVPLPAKRGTLILLDGRLPHKSEHNYSDKPRHAYTLHIIEGEKSQAKYLEDNWLIRDPELPLRCLYDVKI